MQTYNIMKLLIETTNYDQTIKIAQGLNREYEHPITFHCFWHGNLNDKHLNSILSCYYFNVHKNKHRIILWLENNTPNTFNHEIEKYAEIRSFSLIKEKEGTFLETKELKWNNTLTPNWSLAYLADLVRTLLLYKYGGCWFDLDCFFLRSFDPLFKEYGNEICVYQWGSGNNPNNAIYFSLKPFSEPMKKNIEFIMERNRGWGFGEAGLTYDLPLDMLVLPCTWFDAAWIDNRICSWDSFFEKTDKIHTFDTFYNGAFCFHWHNRWTHTIQEQSIFDQLVAQIKVTLQIANPSGLY